MGKARVTGDETAIWVEFEGENAREGSVGGRSKIIEGKKKNEVQQVPTSPLPGYLDLTYFCCTWVQWCRYQSTTVAGKSYVP